MSTFQSVTPNLIVNDVAASTAFYRDVLGFAVKQTVPDAAPFVFVWLERDGVPVFVNARHAASEDYPGAADRPAGGTAALFFVVTDVDALHGRPARDIVDGIFAAVQEFRGEKAQNDDMTAVVVKITG